MCFFRAPSPGPIEVAKGPPPMAPQNQQKSDDLPTKKELVDPDEKAGVEFGTTAKQTAQAGKSGTGANALKIKVNTGGASGQEGVGANTGVG